MANSEESSGDAEEMSELGTNVPPHTTPRRDIEITTPETSRLDGPVNYQVWSYRLKRLLERNNVWIYCTEPRSRNAAAAEKEGRKIALQAITDSVKDSVIPVVCRFEDPHLLWKALEDRYQSKSGSRRLVLLQKLVSLRKEDGTSMEQYVTEVKDIIDQLKGMEVKIPEDLCTLLLLNSLSSKYKLFCRTQTGRDTLPSFLMIVTSA